MSNCLQEQDFQRYFAGELNEAERAQSDAHLDQCETCRARRETFIREHEDWLRFVREAAGPIDTNVTPVGQSPPPKSPDPDAPAPAEQAGQEIGPYRLLGKIGAGGFGEVWAAEQTKPVRRRVALKIVKAGMDTHEVLARFEAERQALAVMDHPNVAKVFDAGATPSGRPYFVMEFVSGLPITDYCDSARLRIKDRLKLFVDICQAVQHAHQKGIIHRDLKPSNILVALHDGKPVPKVIDFGVAKATIGRLTEKTLYTEIGRLVGTPEYMSPEQAGTTGLDVDTRADVYSLGVVLYELLTGTLPFDAKTLRAAGFEGIARMLREMDPPKPSTRLGTMATEMVNRRNGGTPDTISKSRDTEFRLLQRELRGDLDWITLKAMEKDRGRRYETASAFAADVQRHLSGEPVMAAPPSIAYRLRKYVRKHRREAVAASIGVVSTLIVMPVLGFVAVSVLSENKTLESRVAFQDDDLRHKERKLRSYDQYELLTGFDYDPITSATHIPEILKEPAPDDAGRIAPNATVSINLDQLAPPERLQPIFPTPSELLVCELVFDRLFWRDDALALVPNERILQPPPNDSVFGVVVLELRPEATFHDGKPLTADDVVFSWRQAVDPRVKGVRCEQLGDLEDVVAEGPHRLRFVFKAGAKASYVGMNFDILPKHVYEPGLAEDPTMRESAFYKALDRQPVGSGPYRIEAWNDDSITLRRHPSGEQRTPYVDRLIVKWIPVPYDRLAAFRSRDLDVCPLTDVQLDEFKATCAEVGEWASMPSSTFLYIQWNCRADYPFADPRVRQALSRALDQTAVITEVTGNLGITCFGPWHPQTTQAQREREYEWFNYDLAEADRLLVAAGWTRDSQGPRVRTRSDGSVEPLSFRLMITTNSPRAKRTAEILQSGLEQLGVTMEIKESDPRIEFTLQRSQGTFDALLAAATASVDPSLMREFFVSGGTLNYGGYSNPRVDALFAEGAVATDAGTRANLYRQLDRVIYEDQPFTFLYYKPSLWAVSKRLRGVNFSLRGPYYFDPGILDWWVPREGALAGGESN